jgi:AGZA family xanthine/uracil permease-like MFS transporter
MLSLASAVLDATPIAWLTWADVTAALATLADAIGEGFVALTLGFAAKPAGVGFLLGAVLLLSGFGVVPVSFEVESLTVVSRMANRDWKKMSYIIILAGLLGLVLGIAGAFNPIVDFIVGPILSGLLVGVGVILSFVAIELFREHKIVGGVAIAGAVISYLFLSAIGEENALVYALGISVLAAVIAARFTTFTPVPVDLSRERLGLIPLGRFRFVRNLTVIRGVLALLALRVGTSIAYTTINSDFAGVEPDVDTTNIVAGASGAASGFFGGAPLEPIISATAAAPNPAHAGALMMALMGIILIGGLLPRLVKWVPTAAISGFLVLLGSFLVIPDNIGGVITANDPYSGPVTAVVTAATFDPFLGIVAGIIVRFLTDLFL